MCSFYKENTIGKIVYIVYIKNKKYLFHVNASLLDYCFINCYTQLLVIDKSSASDTLIILGGGNHLR